MPAAKPGTWTDYVMSVIEEGERQIDVANRTGVDQTTVSRWLHGEPRSISSQTVAKFARGYGRPVLEAFVAAGFIEPSEVGITPSNTIDWRRVSDAELLRELQRRLRSRSGGLAKRKRRGDRNPTMRDTSTASTFTR